MYAYPLCLLLFATGQPGAPTEPAAPSQPQAYSPQTLTPPTFQQPSASAAAAVVSDPDRSTRSSLEMRSAFGEPEANLAPAIAGAAPATSTLQNGLIASAHGNSAIALMHRALRKPAESAIEGTPVSLHAVLTGSPSRTRQSGAVDAYWQLSKSLAEYHFAVNESRIFGGLSSPQSVHQRALLAAEEASAKARSATARVAVAKAQHALAEAAQLAVAGQLPLPSDPPFTGAYRTHFKVLNDQGAAPDRLGPIDRALPLMRESIDAQAEAVLANESALEATQLAYQQGQATLEDVMGIYRDLRHQRRAFLSSVYHYNEHIARYAFSVSLPGTSAEGIVGMLIETPDAERSVLASKRTDSSIRRVSNEEEIDGWSPSTRETFGRPGVQSGDSVKHAP